MVFEWRVLWKVSGVGGVDGGDDDLEEEETAAAAVDLVLFMA